MSANKLDAKLCVGVSGVVTAEVMRRDGTVRQRVECPNMILNAGLNALMAGNGGNPQAACYIYGFVAGTSGADPLATQTTIASYAGGGNSAQGATSTPLADGGGKLVQTYTFRSAEGGITGNVTQIGFYMSSGVPAAARQLFNLVRLRTPDGAPVTISPQADEYVQTTLTLTYHYSFSSGTFTYDSPTGVQTTPYWFGVVSLPQATLSPNNIGVAYSMCSLWPYIDTDVRSASGVNSAWTNILGPQSTVYPQPSHVIQLQSADTYVAGSFTRTATYRLPLNNGNYSGGLYSIIFRFRGGTGASSGGAQITAQLYFENPIPKAANLVFDVPLTVTVAAVS